MIYVLDTMVISEGRKPRPHGAVEAWFAATPVADYAIPSVVFFELQRGVELTRRQDPVKAHYLNLWVDSLEQTATILPFDQLVARETARILERKSPELFIDAAIAATARIYGLIVATRNTHDFRNLGVSLVNPFSFRSA